MKNFSKKWIASKLPKKQRKFRAKAPLHLRKKFVSVNLSKELRKKQGKRNVPVKTGDTVKILRGKFKGKSGKITNVFLKISKVTIEGIQATKQDGAKVNLKMQPSNLQITALNLEGNRRFEKTKSSSSETSKKEKSDDKTKVEKKK
jgi:large subunit ribosomal protein L24